MTATLEPARALPGDQVVASGGPFSQVYDTRVQVGGIFANVLSVESNLECDVCASCRFNNECQTCGRCLECTSVCDACVETTTFVVPPVDIGQTSVTIFNRHGSTDAIPLMIADAPICDTDSDTDDSGLPPCPTDTDTDTDSDTDATDTDATDTDTN